MLKIRKKKSKRNTKLKFYYLCTFNLRKETLIIIHLKSIKMKKVLLLSLSLVLGFSAFAQRQVIKNDIVPFKASINKTVVGNDILRDAPADNFVPQTAKSVVINRWDNMEDGETMWTYYDLQSNSWCSNRMYQLPNGSVAVTATMSHQNNQTASDRGTGYNFFDGNEWDDQPEEWAEGQRTGWPTIAQWGQNGEILLSHAPIRLWMRETAGQGEWVLMSTLPASPEGYPYSDDASWPRVATSGDNHNIIHVIADIQHSGDAVEHHQVYYRSTDGVNWTCQYSPLAQDGEETNHYTADAYSIAANGHTVAMIYSDDLQGHVVMYKSTDDGETWERTVIWENPYYGYDWATDPQSVFTDTLFGPSNTTIAIDNNGVCHVAMNTYEYIHDELGDTYTTYSGRAVDGIYYWNDTQEAPIQSEDGNPHHALRLWWPAGDGYVQMHADSTKWAGYLPMFEDENGNLIQYDNDKFYRESDYFYKFRSGQSGMPVLSIDPLGNIAMAYSAPCTAREGEYATAPVYLRSIFVSYRNVDEGYWHQCEDNLTDDEVNFMYMVSENIFPLSVTNTVNPGEFWFGFESDDEVGLYWGSEATQGSGTENTIHACKVIASPEFVSVPENNDAQEVVYNVYPNPATDYMVVKSAQNVEANISIVNLVGQTVKQFNKSLKAGENAISIDLNSGIYFCTISANGFNKTIKFVVK